jgi:hypothetical protein
MKEIYGYRIASQVPSWCWNEAVGSKISASIGYRNPILRPCNPYTSHNTSYTSSLFFIDGLQIVCVMYFGVLIGARLASCTSLFIFRTPLRFNYRHWWPVWALCYGDLPIFTAVTYLYPARSIPIWQPRECVKWEQASAVSCKILQCCMRINNW